MNPQNKGFGKTICISPQQDGRWYGRIDGSDDGHGNEIDACLNTPEEILAILLEDMYDN